MISPDLSMDFLQGLNPEQRRAAAHVNGPLLILAGAGSGKTRVITHRIAHLIATERIPGPAILAVTFTNKAAAEMRERVEKLLSAVHHTAGPTVSTFHSFCVRLLRRDGNALAQIRPGFTRTFTIYDDDDQLSIIKSIYRNIGIDEKNFMPYRGVLSAISNAKSHKDTPDDLARKATDPKATRVAVVYEQYEGALRKANALDFDDLLLESVRLLYHDEATRTRYNQRITHLMIDEYQDTNRSQYELMRLLSQRHRNVAVVGDEDQSIYGWRGADIRNILDFENDFPDATVIRLERNYRSTKNILEAASAVVANNKQRKGKWLWTEESGGPKIGIYEALDGENEALFIADSIDRALSRNPDDHVAVLYRTNSQSRQIEEALRRYNRAYNVVGGFSFYQRAEIKDVLAYLKLILSPADSIALLRIVNTPARGIGKSSIEQVEHYALENDLSLWDALGRMLEQNVFPTRAAAAFASFRRLIQEFREKLHLQQPTPLEPEPEPETIEDDEPPPPLFAQEHLVDMRSTWDAPAATAPKPLDSPPALDVLLRDLLERTGYKKMLESAQTPESESRIENLNEMVNAAAEAAERGEGLEEFLDHAALVSDADAVDERAPISLLTIHNAKGLEFPIVFMAGMEEGLFPHNRSLNSVDQMEEERRLCYVGMTRARRQLCLSWARYRRRFGGGQQEATIRSRFLSEVPRELTDRLREDAGEFVSQVDLSAERYAVRETVKKNTYTGKTYNSLENVQQFFAERGKSVDLPNVPRPASTPPPPPARLVAPVAKPVAAAPPAAKKRPGGWRSGSVVHHPKYGRGSVIRVEGDGDDAKLTISFPGYGLKKVIAKFAGIKVDE
jgi:DNA helicase-2/ATP-dependent DNA helicase PcrA